MIEPSCFCTGPVTCPTHIPYSIFLLPWNSRLNDIRTSPVRFRGRTYSVA